MRLKIDLHIHTVYSDGYGTIKEILEKAKLKGLDGLAFTDHDNLEGYFRAKEIDSGLLVIPGFEANTDAGHVLVLGLEQLPPRVGKVCYEDLIWWARSLGGLTVLAHLAAGRLRFDRWMRCKPDAIEVLNSSYPSSRFFISRGLWIARKLGLPAVGGSDAHYTQTVGDAYTLVEAIDPNSVDIIEAVRAGLAGFGGTLSPLPIRLRTGLRYLTHSLMKHVY